MAGRAVSRLDVYLGDELVGTLERQSSSRLRFSYSDATVASYGDGAVLLSALLPVSAEPFTNGACKPFFEGLLPEGEIRTVIARELGVSSGNTFALLEQLGLDCAGAVVTVAADAPGPKLRAGHIVWMDEEELGARIAALPTSPLGVNPAQGVRLSLGGVQDKLVVVRIAGQTGLPQDGTPSTHLIKPGNARYLDLVANESFCMRTARCVGARTADVAIESIAGTDCLVVERYDRTLDGSGRYQRLHQEDFCQALGILPAEKYEAEGGPSFRQMFDLLQLLPQPARTRTDLLNAAIINFLLGNSDAHGKNFSVVYDRGRATLAPLYDIVSTAPYAVDQRLAMAIGGEFDPSVIDLAAWGQLAEECGLNRSATMRHVGGYAARILKCAEATAELARAQSWHRPVIDQILEVARSRATQVGAPRTLG